MTYFVASVMRFKQDLVLKAKSFDVEFAASNSQDVRVALKHADLASFILMPSNTLSITQLLKSRLYFSESNWSEAIWDSKFTEYAVSGMTAVATYAANFGLIFDVFTFFSFLGLAFTEFRM